MCEYPIIAPPFTLKFAEMSKKELDGYFDWYLEQIPGRIAILERTVKCTPGFEEWQADFTPQSLEKLGEWFTGQIEMRERAEEEIQEMKAGLSWPAGELPIPKQTLTNKSFSLAFDIGMYLSQVMLKNITGLKWDHKTKGSKRWVEYGQPVLGGSGWRVFNPTRVIVSLAFSLIKKTEESTKLKQIFEYIKEHAAE